MANLLYQQFAIRKATFCIAFLVLLDTFSANYSGIVVASPVSGRLNAADSIKRTHTATVSTTMTATATTTSTEVLTVTNTVIATQTNTVTETHVETVTNTVTKDCGDGGTTPTTTAVVEPTMTSMVTLDPTTTTLDATTTTSDPEPTPTEPVLCPIKEEVLLDFDDIAVGRTDYTIPELYHNFDFPSWSGLDWLLVSSLTVSSPRGPSAITSLPNALLSPARGNYISFGSLTSNFLFDLLSVNISAWTNSEEGSNHPEGLVFNIIGEKADGTTYPLRSVKGLVDGGGVKFVGSGAGQDFEGLVGLVRVWVAAWDTWAERDVFGRMISANFLLDDLRIAIRPAEC